MPDICPIMSINKDKPVECTSRCGFFDTGNEECAVSRINGELKGVVAKLDELKLAVEQIAAEVEDAKR